MESQPPLTLLLSFKKKKEECIDGLATLLVLGRVSNLPTIWSNCIAGWILGGGGSLSSLPSLWIGMSLLYIGGMYLNDACDASFDALHRKERPIPSKAVSQQSVFAWSVFWLGSGILFLSTLGAKAFWLGKE